MILDPNAVESVVVRRINTLLKQHGLGVFKYRPVPSRYGARILDYINCAYGYYFAIEAKRPRKQPTKLQEFHLGCIQQAGGATFKINSETDIEALAKWLEWCRSNPLSSVLACRGMTDWPKAVK